MTYFSTEVTLDADDVVKDIPTDALEKELKRRQNGRLRASQLEEIYFAMRIKNDELATELMRDYVCTALDREL